jgi:flavin reductase (DIM6/NTAB) family NADH-FMN oxidoreductase RutF
MVGETFIDETATTAVDLRPFMAHFPSGVTVVTAVADDVPRGMTCNSLSSVSLAPPILLICLRRGSPTLDAVLSAGSFSINLLHGDSRSTAALFASGALDKFDRIDWRPSTTGGLHLITDAFAVADCALVEQKPFGDHVVVFGEVLSVSSLNENPPLLYGQHRYEVWPSAG